jgi:hypothetical protein
LLAVGGGVDVRWFGHGGGGAGLMFEANNTTGFVANLKVWEGAWYVNSKIALKRSSSRYWNLADFTTKGIKFERTFSQNLVSYVPTAEPQ